MQRRRTFRPVVQNIGRVIRIKHWIDAHDDHVDGVPRQRPFDLREIASRAMRPERGTPFGSMHATRLQDP